MAVLHIYTKNGKIYCTAKEPFLGKEKPLPNLPAFSELFSSGVTCVVFKLPSLLKTRNFKLICFALLSFVLRKYYRQKIPKLFVNFQRFPTLDAKKLVNAPKMSAHHRGICHF